jgi:hypothetical protein
MKGARTGLRAALIVAVLGHPDAMAHPGLAVTAIAPAPTGGDRRIVRAVFIGLAEIVAMTRAIGAGLAVDRPMNAESSRHHCRS